MIEDHRPELTPEEWQYLSVLLAADIREDRRMGNTHGADRRTAIWHKIQPKCEWSDAT